MGNNNNEGGRYLMVTDKFWWVFGCSRTVEAGGAARQAHGFPHAVPDHDGKWHMNTMHYTLFSLTTN